ncbi:MAG TPA: hypothetical protein VII99_12345 [Bacteroidia bacterium]
MTANFISARQNLDLLDVFLKKSWDARDCPKDFAGNCAVSALTSNQSLIAFFYRWKFSWSGDTLSFDGKWEFIFK